MNTRKSKLYDSLIKYSKSDSYPFHMPGHKRNSQLIQMVNPIDIDITEIDGFDNLHDASGIIEEIMKNIKSIYGTQKSYLLINGSSCGILSAIMAATEENKNILVSRNCHKSTYNAITLGKLNSFYILPEYNKKYGYYGKVVTDEVEKKLEEANNLGRQIGSVVITSPTYEGIVSDIKEISNIVHKYGAILIVDEAHGAHFNWSDEFPKSAVECGADVVIQSLHKTLPSMTQTAVLHVCSDRIDDEKISKYLSMFQSSSPSYVLMSSIESCINLLIDSGEMLFEKYLNQLTLFYEEAKDLENLKVLAENYYKNQYDYGKIVVLTNENMTGKELYNILLNEFHLQMEMASERYVIAMTSICDTKEGFDRLIKALKIIDERIDKKKYVSIEKVDKKQQIDTKDINNINQKIDQIKNVDKKRNVENLEVSIPEKCCEIYEVDGKKINYVIIEEAVGKIAAKPVYLYPPGSPLILPGEIYNGKIVSIIERSIKENLYVIGIKGQSVAVID